MGNGKAQVVFNEHTRKLAQDAGREGAREALTILGFDLSAPTAIQKDIAHLRRSRELCELIQNKLVMAVIIVLVTGTMAAAWTGFAYALNKKQAEIHHE
jgi:hypothetical protein